jgi:hypothetical protein
MTEYCIIENWDIPKNIVILDDTYGILVRCDSPESIAYDLVTKYKAHTWRNIELMDVAEKIFKEIGEKYE